MRHILRMRRHLIGGVAAVAGLVTLAATSVPALAAAQAEIRHADAAGAISGRYIVVFKDIATKTVGVQALAADLATRHRATITHTYGAALRGFAAAMDEKEAKRLAANPAVDYIVQDAEAHLTDTQPNPTWGLDRIDQADRPVDRLYTYQNTAPNVHVYIIDSGIRVTHSEFGGRASWGANFTGDGINTDCFGHGTHVAGSVGGVNFGVAKGVQLHAVKVFTCSGSSPVSVIIAGVDWVTANRIRPAVANMSLGAAVNTALDNAVRNSIGSGVTYAIAAGNDNGANACQKSPARVFEALTVGASTAADTRASFSNIGTCVDLFAPGEGILSAWNNADNGVLINSGTSMATPHVAGVAAIYLSTNVNATPGTVQIRVRENSTVRRLTGIGAGSPNNLLFSQFIAPGPGTGVLLRGQQLNPGQSLRSERGNHVLVMQGDGNLVHYQRGRALWSTSTFNPGSFAVLQGDGNLVVYRPGGVPVWASNTAGTPVNQLVMQDDGNVVLYDSALRAYWSSFFGRS